MSISDVQYQVWLASDNQRRVMLAEIEYHDGSAVSTAYFATSPYVSEPSDTPPDQAYDDAIISTPTFTRRLSNGFGGRGTGAWGGVELINQTGQLDAWLGYGFDGRAIRLYFGDQSWPKADFRPVLTGTIADITINAIDRITVKISDKAELLNIQIQNNVIGGTGPNAGKLKPLLFGQCANISPLLIDAPTHQYQYHDGAAEGVIAVYDNGVSIGFTDSPTLGTFVLLASPAGQITCDAKGAKPSGVYLVKTADIVNHIITTRSTLTSADVDSASITAMNTAAPQTLGLYITGRENIVNAIDKLVESVGGWWAFSRAGLLQLGVLLEPSGTPDVTLLADDIRRGGVTVRKRELPWSQVMIGYAKNWTVQASGLAGSVTESRMAELAEESKTATATQSIPRHTLAEKPEQIETLMISSIDAAAEAARLLALRDVSRHTFSIDAYAAPFSIELGDVVSVTYPRLGFTAGALAVVVGMEETPNRGAVKLEVWN